jgi:hypothetical protein
MGGSPGPDLRTRVILRRFPGLARPSGAALRLARTPGEPNDILDSSDPPQYRAHPCWEGLASIHGGGNPADASVNPNNQP